MNQKGAQKILPLTHLFKNTVKKFRKQHKMDSDIPLTSRKNLLFCIWAYKKQIALSEHNLLSSNPVRHFTPAHKYPFNIVPFLACIMDKASMPVHLH